MLYSTPRLLSSSSSGTSSSGTPPEDAYTALMAHISHLGPSELDTFLAMCDSDPESLASVLDDDELALVLFAQEAEGLLQIARDHMLEDNGDEDSDELLDELLRMEENAEYDRTVALALSRDMDPPPRPPPRGRPRRRLHEQDRSAAFAHSPSLSPVRFHHPTTTPHRRGVGQETPPLSRSPLASRAGTPYSLLSAPSSSPSISPVSSRSPSPQPTYSCTICQDEIDGAIIHLSCGHLFDTSCLRTMFENATKDESLFPPKCCLTTIDIDTVQMDLGAPLVEQYKRKSREFKTKDRVYCHNPTCSAFLGGATVAAPAAFLCAECHSETCGSCKDAAHNGQTCDARRDETMLEFAKGQGWQRCPSCKHLVELTEGCYHMICRCEKQFCYLCAAVWKTCECPLFHAPDEEPAPAQPVA